ncbi:MAG: hypothetical protein ABWY62_01055 [Acidimicrobiia bacterium]
MIRWLARQFGLGTRSMSDYGSQQLFSGLRTGNSTASALGTALLVLSWMRNHRPPARELLYVANLNKGETLTVRLVGDDGEIDEAEVTG